MTGSGGGSAVSALTIGTYVYLIATDDFPRGEWLNVMLIAVNLALLVGLYPWRAAHAA